MTKTALLEKIIDLLTRGYYSKETLLKTLKTLQKTIYEELD